MHHFPSQFLTFMASSYDGELNFKLAVRDSSARVQNDFTVQSLPTLTRIRLAYSSTSAAALIVLADCTVAIQPRSLFCCFPSETTCPLPCRDPTMSSFTVVSPLQRTLRPSSSNYYTLILAEVRVLNAPCLLISLSQPPVLSLAAVSRCYRIAAMQGLDHATGFDRFHRLL